MKLPTSISKQSIGVALALALATPSVLLAKNATQPLTPELSESLQQSLPGSFADIVSAVKPAVVNIAVTGKRAGSTAQPNDPQMEEFMRRYFGKRSLAPSARRPMQGQGSGFIVSEDGFVVTNHHVIAGAEKIEVIMVNGDTFTATVKGSDQKTDIALLKIEADGALPWVEFGDADKAREGDWVIAIGNPFGLGGTTSTGIISARGRDINAGPFDDYIQFDAPINRGNSGGPLFNTEGRVIGINTAIYSPNGGSVGIGFAVPESLARSVIDQLQSTGQVSRGWLGVQIQAVDDALAESLQMEKPAGALVNEVIEDSPAKLAGLQRGDVIIEYDGEQVSDMRDLPRLVALTEAARTVTVGVWRAGQQTDLEVAIGHNADEPALAASNATDPATDSAKLGITLAQIDDRIRSQLGLEASEQGVVVVDVAADSPAARRGLRAGDVIRSVNQQPVTSIAEAKRILSNLDRKAVLLLIARAGQERFVAVPVA